MNNDVLSNANTLPVRKKNCNLRENDLYDYDFCWLDVSSDYVGKSLFSNRKAIYGVYLRLTKRLDFDEIRQETTVSLLVDGLYAKHVISPKRQAGYSGLVLAGRDVQVMIAILVILRLSPSYLMGRRQTAVEAALPDQRDRVVRIVVDLQVARLVRR